MKLDSLSASASASGTTSLAIDTAAARSERKISPKNKLPFLSKITHRERDLERDLLYLLEIKQVKHTTQHRVTRSPVPSSPASAAAATATISAARTRTTTRRARARTAS